MNATTFDEILTCAANLSEEEQQLLMEVLRKRQIDKWREETGADGRRAIKAFRAGKLKARAVDQVINDLRASLNEND
jgi:hypothetical protein